MKIYSKNTKNSAVFRLCFTYVRIAFIVAIKLWKGHYPEEVLNSATDAILTRMFCNWGYEGYWEM